MIDLQRALRIAGWMTLTELEWLAQTGADAQLIVEVGAWKGRSTRAFADNTRGVVHVVDNWAGHDGTVALPDDGFNAFRENLADHLQTGRVIFAKIDSLYWPRALRSKQIADVVFLDGDHTYARVSSEIAAYRSVVKAGGVLAGHDYWNPQHPGVTRAVDEAFQPVNHIESIWWVRV